VPSAMAPSQTARRNATRPDRRGLRRARLDAAALKLTISLRPPGVGMPPSMRRKPLRGRPAGDLYPAPRTLSSAEIDAVVAYLQARILGHGADYETGMPRLLLRQADWCDDYN